MTSAPAAASIASIHVVIPAKDEEQLLPGCLQALEQARNALRLSHPSVSCAITVVADACTDRTVDIARAHQGVRVIEPDVGSVGRARAVGIESLQEHRAVSTDRQWIACTDADSSVPEHWLSAQVTAADSGYDVVLGTVQPTGDLPTTVYQRWLRDYEMRTGHRHVHGANLGFRLSVYQAAGGFEDLPVHEDVSLVRRMVAMEAKVLASHLLPVRTSGRLVGRSPGGFAAYLHQLATQSPDPDQLAAGHP